MFTPESIKKRLKSIHKSRQELDKREKMIRSKCVHDFVKISDWTQMGGFVTSECSICGEKRMDGAESLNFH